MRSSLLVTCDRSVVFSGYSGFYTNKTDHHTLTYLLLKAALSTMNQPTLEKCEIWNHVIYIE